MKTVFYIIIVVSLFSIIGCRTKEKVVPKTEPKPVGVHFLLDGKQYDFIHAIAGFGEDSIPYAPPFLDIMDTCGDTTLFIRIRPFFHEQPWTYVTNNPGGQSISFYLEKRNVRLYSADYHFPSTLFTFSIDSYEKSLKPCKDYYYYANTSGSFSGDVIKDTTQPLIPVQNGVFYIQQ